MENWAIRQKFHGSYHGGHCNHIDQGLDSNDMQLWYSPMVSNAEIDVNIDFNYPLRSDIAEMKPEKYPWDEFLVDEDVANGLPKYDDKPEVNTESYMANSTITFSFPSNHSGIEEQQSEISEESQKKSSEEQQSEISEESHKRSSEEIVDSKKMKRKRKTERASKYAFKTRSESDSLEDGYKWRKYGRKFVKTSTYPRSYYRCSDSNCSVKKRVERDASDPELLITTYEGKHNHESPSVIYYIGKPILLPQLQAGSKPAIVFVNTGLCP